MQDIVRIFCAVDDWCKAFEGYCNQKILLADGAGAKGKKISFCHSKRLSLSEVMTITIYFHQSHYRAFKHYYKDFVMKRLKAYFPHLVSYNRFVELMQEALFPLIVYTQKACLGECSGVSFIDSTTLDVCDNRRIHNHKVFAGIASRGKSSTGWFYGFKLHITINECGEILSCHLTDAATDDRNESVIDALTRNLYGKLFGDKGYLSARLFERLYKRGIYLVTKLKSNMQNRLVKLEDKLLLRKRAVIESVNDFLKNQCYIEHSRHRSFANFCTNLVAGIAAYSFLPKKPSIIDRFAAELGA